MAFEAGCCRKLRSMRNIVQQGQKGASRSPCYSDAPWSAGRFPSPPVVTIVLRLSGKKRKPGSFASVQVLFFQGSNLRSNASFQKGESCIQPTSFLLQSQMRWAQIMTRSVMQAFQPFYQLEILKNYSPWTHRVTSLSRKFWELFYLILRLVSSLSLSPKQCTLVQVPEAQIEMHYAISSRVLTREQTQLSPKRAKMKAFLLLDLNKFCILV